MLKARNFKLELNFHGQKVMQIWFGFTRTVHLAQLTSSHHRIITVPIEFIKLLERLQLISRINMFLYSHNPTEIHWYRELNEGKNVSSIEPNAIVESHWSDHRQWLSHGSLARDSVCFLNESAQPNIMCTMTKKSCRNTRQATSFRSPHLLARVNGVLISNWIYHSHTRARGVNNSTIFGYASSSLPTKLRRQTFLLRHKRVHSISMCIS